MVYFDLKIVPCARGDNRDSCNNVITLHRCRLKALNSRKNVTWWKEGIKTNV